MTGPSPGERTPEQFGTYKVFELLGTGGMGRVYRALDEALQREVALKTLLPALAADADFVTRFTREARSAAALNHPNITQIYSIGQEGAVPYFAMELIRGQSLEALAKQKGSLDPLAAAGYILQAASGLRHAAKKGVIHRDIKPSNLMLTEEGVVKITDFGLAKAARAETRLTATGEVLGSPGYISPEQAQGLPTDLRSDIYSLGATFYHLVAGRLPFEAPTAVAMIMKHMNEPLRAPRALNAGIPFPISALIQKMMAKRAVERFQDYDALIRELERLVGEARAQSAVAEVAARSGVRKSPGLSQGRAASEPQPEERRSVALLPVGMMIAVMALVAAGVWDQMKAGRGPASTASPAGGQTGTAPGGPTPPAAGIDAKAGLAALLRDAHAAPDARANLEFLSNDHDLLAVGKLRVMGKIRNSGNLPAQNAKVRIRIVLDNGSVAAQAESMLDPAIIPPGLTATYDIPIDYKGTLGSIKAELIWTD